MGEMDTIIGKEGDEVCTEPVTPERSNLQLYFLLRNKNMFEGNMSIRYYKSFLGYPNYSETFTIILTDNGIRFMTLYRLRQTLKQEGETHQYLFRKT